MKIKYAFAALAVTLSLSAFAAKPLTSGDDAPAAANSNPGALKMATGPKDKGYSKLFANLRDICSAQQPLVEVRTTGGLENLTVLSNKKADVAIAQLDTIKDMAPGNENIAALKAVAVLNYNYLHVLTVASGYTIAQGREWYGAKKADHRVQLQKFSDLKGKRVALVGSAQLMAVALQQRALKDYNMQFVNVATDKEAAAMVASGQVMAMMTVSGVPHGFVESLNQSSNLTVLPFDEDVGGVYVVRKLNYPNINVYNRKALAVPNVLVTRDFGGQKSAQVQKLNQCLLDGLQDLKDGEYEPAWNEMVPGIAVDLPRFNRK